MGTRSASITSQVVGDGEYAGRSLGYVYNPATLSYEVSTPGGGGGAVTIADGADSTQGAKADAAWDGAAASASGISIWKYLGQKLEAIRALVAGTINVSGTFWQATQPVSGPLTDAQLRAVAVPVSAAALPLPTGAATEATLGLVKAKTDNLDVALSVVAKDATLTGGTAKAIARGGAKGATVAADVTSTAEGANNQALDVQIYHGGAAKDPTAIRALTAADIVALGAGAAQIGLVKISDGLDTALVSTGGRLYVRDSAEGRSNVSLYAEAVAGIIAETAISINKSVQFAAAAAATSNGPTAGKTLRITGMIISWVSTSTTANTCRLRLRVNPAGAAIISSPIAFSGRISWESATFIANEGEFQYIGFGEGIEIPSGGAVMATLACVAANGTLDIQLVGYEYTP